MSHKHSGKHIPYCLNCHYPLAEFDSFCPNCGQKPTDGKVTMHDLLHELTHTLFHVDGKLFSTLKHIFIPGKLTEEFFKGHHKRYAHPIQLFLVLGAAFLFFVSLLSHKLEEKLKKKIEEDYQKTEQRRLIADLDSSARQMSLYKKDPSVRQAMDSLLMNKLVEIDEEKESASSLQGQAFENTKEIATKRLLIEQLQGKSDSLKKLYSDAFELRMHQLKSELNDLEVDSVALLESFAQSVHVSKDSANIQLKNYMFGRVSRNNLKIAINGKSIFEDNDSTRNLLSKYINDEAQKEAADQLEAEIEGLPKIDVSHAESFLEGIKAGMKRGEKRQRKDVLKTKADNPYQAMQKDSVGNFGFTIAKSDMQNMELHEIFEKYHVKGFWKQRMLGATIMAQRAGQDKLHAFTSKALWIIIFSLLPTAAFLWLLYRRQQRFFVEHVVWLLHVYCFMFIAFPLVFANEFLKLPGITAFGILTLLWPFLALKHYYKQSWGKTFVKYAIFSFAYFFISLFTFTVGGFLSFLFF